MPRMKVSNFKYQTTDTAVPASVSFTGDVLNVEAEGVTVDIEQVLLEEVHADGVEPAEIYAVGTKISGKAVLVSKSLDDLAAQLNGTNSSGITIKSNPDSIAALSKRAITFDLELPGGTNSTETWIITNIVFTGKLSASFKGSEGFYLPIEFRSLKTSQMSIAQTA